MREEVLEEMLEITKSLKERKIQLQKTSELINDTWNKINPLAFEEEKKVYSSEVKMTEKDKEFNIKYNKYHNDEIQLLMKDINSFNIQVDVLKIEISDLELQFKAYRTAYGVVVSDY